MNTILKYMLVAVFTVAGFYAFAWFATIPCAAIFPGYELRGAEHWKRDAALGLGIIIGIGGGLAGAAVALLLFRPKKS